ncbi:MAG TPA: deoxyribose-phosphate aldolase [Bacteroidales bacterium]|nr:deoxyribose-phosphate aldolase [Bacteroidales bacterium]
MTKLYQKLIKSGITAEKVRPGNRESTVIYADEKRAEVLRAIFSFIDLTSLNVTDNPRIITDFTQKVSSFDIHFPGMKNVAAVCVFPNFVQPAIVGLNKCGVRLAVVSASFPTSQTFLEVKVSETEIAVRNGADEIDVVMPLGTFLERDYEAVIGELKALRLAAGDATLKVILETGVLRDNELIYRAAVVAIESGADFIKTSTGKSSVSATPEAAWVICRAILDYYKETGIMIGFKAAGGIVSPDEAIIYYNIVKNELGEKWLDPSLFRIGASRLANGILHELYPEKPAYF